MRACMRARVRARVIYYDGRTVSAVLSRTIKSIGSYAIQWLVDDYYDTAVWTCRRLGVVADGSTESRCVISAHLTSRQTWFLSLLFHRFFMVID